MVEQDKGKQEKSDFKHIVRILNTDVDGNKPILYSLRKIKGVSFMFANALCSVSCVDPNKKSGNLNNQEVEKLNQAIKDPEKFAIPQWMFNRRKDYETGQNKHLLTADLDFTKENDLKRLKMTKSYKGLRHAANLPVRGQRTKSNFRPSKRSGKSSLGVKKKAGAKAGRV